MRSSEPPENDSTRQNADENLKNLYHDSLKSGSIRLLCLLPHKDEDAPIQCQLFEYPLQKLGEGTHLYEALSYVWGNPTDCSYVFVNEHYFPVTANLHAALLSLRDRFFKRIIWVDAICIDQEDKGGNGEKGEQILRMAEIYSKASRVIVWLGKAENDSNQVLEEIRLAADDVSAEPKPNKQAILTLLQRSWFKRIWVREQTLIIDISR
jgi:hypothetical protein